MNSANKLESTSTYVNAGLTLHYLILGPESGHIVVFLHGLGSNRLSWLECAEELAAKGYRCYLLDARGHGRSDRVATAPDDGYRMEQYTSDPVSFLDQIVKPTGRKCVMVGHSLGAAMTYGCTAVRQELVAGMLLEGAVNRDAIAAGQNRINETDFSICNLTPDPPMYMSPARFDSGPYRPVFLSHLSDCQNWRSLGTPISEITQTVASRPIAPGSATTFADLVTESALTASVQGRVEVDVAAWQAALQGRTTSGAEKPPCSVPGILLRADKNLGPAFQEEDVERFKKIAPNVEIVEVKGAGHLIHASRTSRKVLMSSLEKVLSIAF
ncbi:hypothetical protein HDU93_005400 [Gonapodya sp. JEL0774]|nr:hypothetical protein HDU93_005400 [Gonapodya sp. JEL0774]